MATQQSYFTNGIARSDILGNQNTVADISGVNLQRKRGAAVQNKKMDKLIDNSNINPVAIVPETLSDSLIFGSDRRIFRNNGKTIAHVGNINAYKGIDIFTFAAASDISLHNKVLVALDAVENQVIFADVEENGVNSRVELDESIHMLPVPTTDYRGVAINSTHIYFIDGTTKITRFRLGTDGRIAQANGTDTALPTYADGTPVGIAVNSNGIAVLYSNKFIRTGTFDNDGEITFNNVLVDLSATAGQMHGLGADDDRLFIAQPNNVIYIPIADRNMTLTTSSAVSFANTNSVRNNTAVATYGGTVMTLDGISVLFATHTVSDGTFIQTLNETVKDAVQYGKYVYYATSYSLGRWEVGKDFNTRNDTFKFFLNGNKDFHPMFKLFDSLFIGDAHVVAQLRDETFIRKALDIFPEFTIRCLGQIQNNLLIGTQGSAVSSYGSSQVFIWDTFSDSWTSSKLIPEKGVTAFIDTGLFIIVIAGNEANMYYFDGFNARLFQPIGSGNTEVLPRHIIQYEGQTYIARGGRIYSVYGTFIQAGNQEGANAILNGEHTLEKVMNDDIQILSVRNDKLSCMRADGFYTLSDNLHEDIMIRTRIAISNSEIAPTPKSFMLTFIDPPINGTVSIVQLTGDGDKFLEGNFTDDKKTFISRQGNKSRTLQFVCKVVGSDDNPASILSTILIY